MDATRLDAVAEVQSPVSSGPLLTPPAPELSWKPSALLIAGLDDAGLVGEWPPTESIDLTVWKPQPKRPGWRKVSQAIH
jgi:hypothetical protein